jgi:hypothetical protein
MAVITIGQQGSDIDDRNSEGATQLRRTCRLGDLDDVCLSLDHMQMFTSMATGKLESRNFRGISQLARQKRGFSDSYLKAVQIRIAKTATRRDSLLSHVCQSKEEIGAHWLTSCGVRTGLLVRCLWCGACGIT